MVTKQPLKHELVFTLFPLVLAPTALSSPRFSLGGRPWEEASFCDRLAHTLPLLEALKLLICLNLASKLGNAQTRAEGTANTCGAGQG